jgi:cardiolipin synthase A/B
LLSNRLPHLLASLLAVSLAAAACSSHSTVDDTVPGVDGGGSSSSGSSGNPGTDGSSGSDGSSSGGDSSTLPDGAPKPDAGPPPSISYTSQVKIIVEPSDDGSALLAAINGAATSVHMTMYMLTENGPVYDALIAAKNRGLEVKVVLNQQFPGGQGSNSKSFSGLKAAGISVVYAPSVYTFTHEKCVVLDKATAWIMTMNATNTSPTDNREYLAVDTDAADVAAAEAIFEADFSGAAANAPGKLLLSPINSRSLLHALLSTATKTIDIEGEELSDTDLVGVMTAKADAGIAVRVVLSDESPPTPAQQTAVTTLKQHKVPVVSVSTPYIHAKAIVVDGVHSYVGSANFTSGSLTGNRELGVLFDTAAEVAKVATTIDTDFKAGTAL